MYGFPLVISCCVKISNIQGKFVKYIDVPLFKAVTHLHQQNKSPEPKVKFRQTSNHCERVPEAPKLVYDNKTKDSITSYKLCSQDFW